MKGPRPFMYDLLITKEGTGKMRGMGIVWMAALMMALAMVVFINVMSWL